MSSMSSALFELRTHNGTHILQPTASQLADAIEALAAPDNTYLSVAAQAESHWYVEVTLPDPDTADVFNGPYEIHYEDRQANPSKWSVYGDDPDTIARAILTWVESMINSSQ